MGAASARRGALLELVLCAACFMQAAVAQDAAPVVVPAAPAAPMPPPKYKCGAAVEYSLPAYNRTLWKGVIEASGLYEQLYSEKVGNFTFFAPSNAAILQALKLLGINNADNLAQVDSRVLRTLVKYNTLAAKIPTIDLYDSMVLQTMLSGSTEPTYCEAPIAQLSAEVLRDAASTTIINSPGADATIFMRDIGACYSYLQLTDHVMLPCCVPLTTVLDVLPSTATARDAILQTSGDQASFNAALLTYARNNSASVTTLLLPTNTAWQRFNVDVLAAEVGSSRTQVLEALVQFHASGIYGLRYGELKAIFRTPTNAAIAGCSSTTMSTGAILVQHFDETNPAIADPVIETAIANQILTISSASRQVGDHKACGGIRVILTDKVLTPCNLAEYVNDPSSRKAAPPPSEEVDGGLYGPSTGAVKPSQSPAFASPPRPVAFNYSAAFSAFNTAPPPPPPAGNAADAVVGASRLLASLLVSVLAAFWMVAA